MSDPVIVHKPDSMAQLISDMPHLRQGVWHILVAEKGKQKFHEIFDEMQIFREIKNWMKDTF